jgi:hypothetical protein
VPLPAPLCGRRMPARKKRPGGVAVNQLDSPLDNINATSHAAELYRPRSYWATTFLFGQNHPGRIIASQIAGAQSRCSIAQLGRGHVGPGHWNSTKPILAPNSISQNISAFPSQNPHLPPRKTRDPHLTKNPRPNHACKKNFTKTLTLVDYEEGRIVCPHCASHDVEQRWSWPQPKPVAPLLHSGPAAVLTREKIRKLRFHHILRSSPMTVWARIS